MCLFAINNVYAINRYLKWGESIYINNLTNETQTMTTHEQIINDLEKRYTAKKYDPSKKVAQQDLDILYQALRLSPSSINSQPWKFIVIESDTAKQRTFDTFAN